MRMTKLEAVLLAPLFIAGAIVFFHAMSVGEARNANWKLQNQETIRSASAGLP